MFRKIVFLVCFYLSSPLYGGNSSTKVILLKNKIEVLLISDPTFSQSSAAINFNVGYLHSPNKFEGLPHYLEHLLLFGGSKLTPEPNDLRTFFSENGGKINAMTEFEDTVYYFQINNKNFSEAVEKVTDIFVNPLFDRRFAEKELHSVDEEYQRNMTNDERKLYALTMSTASSKHPRSMFDIGNSRTLKNASIETVKKFYETHYSANLAKVIFMSAIPLEQMEKIALNYLTKIPNKNFSKIEIPSNAFAKKNLPIFLKMQSAQEKSLHIIFELPEVQSRWRDKPMLLLQRLIENSSEGSLLSYLRKNNLVSSVKNFGERDSFASYLFITFNLTEHGLQQYENVIKNFYSYVKLIQGNGLSRYLFDDYKRINEVKFASKQATNGVQQQLNLTRDMSFYSHYVPFDNFEENIELLQAYEPKYFNDFVKELKFEKSITILSDKTFDGSMIEENYKTKYSINEFSRKFLDDVKKINISKGLTYPNRNKYIPKNLNVLQKSVVLEDQILSGNGGNVFYEFDGKFASPTTETFFSIATDKFYSSLKNKVLTLIYLEALNYSLYEWKISLEEVGNELHIKFDDGLKILFSGYSDILPSLLEDLSIKIKNKRFSQLEFNNAVESVKNNINQLYLKDSDYLAYHGLLDILNQKSILESKIYNPNGNIDLISNLNLKDLNHFSQMLFESTYLSGVIYGNIDHKLAKGVVENYLQIFNKNPSHPAFYDNKSWSIDKGKHYFMPMQSQTENNAAYFYQQIGKKDFKNIAVSMISSFLLKEDFFTEMRTKRQLGYNVGYYMHSTKSHIGVSMYALSHQYLPEYLINEIKVWVAEVPNKLEKITDQKFIEIKNSVIEEINKSPSSQWRALVQIRNQRIVYWIYRFGPLVKVQSSH